MRNVLLALLFIVISGVIWAQDVKIVRYAPDAYQIYEIKEVPIGTLSKVDPDIPEYLLTEVYKRGLLTHDSTITWKEYNAKHFWLTRNTDVSYKIAVFVEKDREIKTVIQPVRSKKLPAVDVYVLLFCFLITAVSLCVVSVRNLIMPNNFIVFFAFILPVIFCFAMLIVTYILLDYSLLYLIAACLFIALLIYSVVINTTKFFTIRKVYLQSQWVNLILIILSSSLITKSFLLPLLLIVIFWVPFGIIVKTVKNNTVPAPPVLTNKFVDEEY
ncbi:MAG: hypothetical protein WAW11_02715 [Patescibacteria group bacterium]